MLEVAAREREAVGEQVARAQGAARVRVGDGAHAAPRSAVAGAGVCVSERKTSSRVTSRRCTSTASTPAASSARTTSISRRAGARGDRHLPALGIGVGRVLAERARASTAAVGSSPALGDGHDEALAADARLELGRACRDAVTWPWSSTTIWSAKRSASSRYCVVSTSVIPSSTRPPQQLPEVVAALRIEPGRRLVEEQHRRARDEARGEIEAAAHAAGVGAHEPVGRLLEAQLREQLAGALAHDGARQVVEAADELEVGARRQQPVDGRALAGEADAGAHLGGRGDRVVAGDERAPRGRQRERGEDADGGRLARPVVAEEAEDAARGSVEARLAQRLRRRRSSCSGLRHRHRPVSMSYLVRYWRTSYEQR